MSLDQNVTFFFFFQYRGSLLIKKTYNFLCKLIKVGSGLKIVQIQTWIRIQDSSDSDTDPDQAKQFKFRHGSERWFCTVGRIYITVIKKLDFVAFPFFKDLFTNYNIMKLGNVVNKRDSPTRLSTPIYFIIRTPGRYGLK